jgi:hypothetical protein
VLFPVRAHRDAPLRIILRPDDKTIIFKHLLDIEHQPLSAVTPSA